MPSTASPKTSRLTRIILHGASDIKELLVPGASCKPFLDDLPPADLHRGGGIYAIVVGEKIYVGYSTEVAHRIHQHAKYDTITNNEIVDLKKTAEWAQRKKLLVFPAPTGTRGTVLHLGELVVHVLVKCRQPSMINRNLFDVQFFKSSPKWLRECHCR